MTSRPADQWRLYNLQKILKVLNENPDISIRTLASEISRITEKKNQTERSVNEAIQHLNKILNKKTTFGDKWAGLIEEAITELAKSNHALKGYVSLGFLDYPPELDVNAYIMASVDVQRWNTICSFLNKIPEVKEAALIIGRSDVDAIIKIEAPLKKLNDILIREIAAHRFINKTQTLSAINYSQWQRAQIERPPELEKLSFITNLEDEYHEFDSGIKFPSDEIKNMFSREEGYKRRTINEINSGRIVIKREAEINLFPEKVVKAANCFIKSVVIWDQIAIGELERIKRYLKIQFEKMHQNDNFNISRVFIFKNPEDLFKSDQSVCERLGCELEIGVKVKYLDRWPNVRDGDKPRDFGVIDSTLRWIMLDIRNREEIRHIDVSVYQPDIEHVTSDFEMIWHYAKDIDEEYKKTFIEAYQNSRSLDILHQ